MSKLTQKRIVILVSLLSLGALVFSLESSRSDHQAILEENNSSYTFHGGRTTSSLDQSAKPQPEKPPYLNPELSWEVRVADLLSRMTLEEKVSQMVHDAPAIERLGIPKYNWWNECLHGVARAGLATVFPQAIGLAATWDTKLLYQVATAISDEARAKHHYFVRQGKRNIYQGLTFWSPNINIFRDPRWGRGMETYGEDPYLAGRLGVAFVRGLQGNHPRYLKTVATPKHYAVHSGPEPDRHTFNAQVDEGDLRETYLPHFEACVKEGGAFSIMCAYNRFRDKACCGSPFLLGRILRLEWGFEGYVVSDCGAIYDIYNNHKIVPTAPEAAALAVKAGCDLNCGQTYRTLVKAVEKGLLSEEDIDRAVRRLFLARFRLGMFDPPEMVPYMAIPYSVVDCAEHRELAREAARKSIVLLKNEGNILPLSRRIRTLAVIGPNANDVEVLLGNYNGTPADPITPLAGLKQKVSPQTKVIYALGCDWAEGLPYLETIPPEYFFCHWQGKRVQGLVGEYFDNRRLTGQPLFTRLDPGLEFNWWDGAPDERLDDDNFGVRWTGELVPPRSGEYYLGGEGFNGFRIYLDGELIAEFNSSHHPRQIHRKIFLEGQRPYRLKVEFFERSGDAHLRLLWKVPGRDLLAEALEAARQAEAVVLFMGLSPRLEGEEMKVEVAGFKGGDRLTLELPLRQQELIKAVAALKKPTILVLLNGSALAVNWSAAHLPAILEAWYPGQAAGEAIADVLFGDYNPAGRLPVTFYKSVDQLPPFTDYRMENRTYRYFRGEPLFPFGYGLSYTRFHYSDLQVPKKVRAGEKVKVSVVVSNIGQRAGEEVVQLYLRDLEASVPVPIRSLKGFKRIHLQPGKKKRVFFELKPEDLSVLDENWYRVVEPGWFEVSLGGKQPGFKGLAKGTTTEVLTTKFEVIKEDEGKQLK